MLSKSPFLKREFVTLLGLALIIQCTAITAPSASAAGIQGDAQVVVVIDVDGVDINHPELIGQVIHEACFSMLKNCPNKSDFQEGPGAAAPQYLRPGVFAAYSGSHGTQVASVVAGKNLGVDNNLRIIAIHVPDYVEPAMDWIYENVEKYNIASVVYSAEIDRLEVGNISSTCDKYTQLQANGEPIYFKDQASALLSKNVATVVASGNGGHKNMTSLPSCVTGVIGVGAVDSENKVERFSNSDRTLGLLARDKVRTATIVLGQHYIEERTEGTSFAAPYVAGAIAVIKAKYPTLSISQIFATLRSTGPRVDDEFIKGIPVIDLSAALAYLATNPEIPTVASTFVGQYSTLDDIQPKKPSTPPVKKAPAKKAPAKKAPVKKAPVKKAPAKKAKTVSSK